MQLNVFIYLNRIYLFCGYIREIGNTSPSHHISNMSIGTSSTSLIYVIRAEIPDPELDYFLYEFMSLWVYEFIHESRPMWKSEQKLTVYFQWFMQWAISTSTFQRYTADDAMTMADIPSIECHLHLMAVLLLKFME